MCTQEQAPLHGWVALQRPLHTPIRPALLCSCRAETVPAKRTVVTITASNAGLIFLPMSPFFLLLTGASRCSANVTAWLQ